MFSDTSHTERASRLHRGEGGCSRDREKLKTGWSEGQKLNYLIWWSNHCREHNNLKVCREFLQFQHIFMRIISNDTNELVPLCSESQEFIKHLYS